MAELAVKNIGKLIELIAICNTGISNCNPIESVANSNVARWLMKKRNNTYKPSPLGLYSKTFVYDSDNSDDMGDTDDMNDADERSDASPDYEYYY